MMKFFRSKRGQITMNNAVDKFVGLTILLLLVSALIGTLLNAVTNLSGSGIALAVLFTTVVPLLIAFAVFKSVMSATK